jgi:hypothetical protein
MTKDHEKAELEESPEDKDLFVVDPEDYQKTRRLKAINDAKDHVRKLRQGQPDRATRTEWNGIHKRLAEAVADYGGELMPLIEDAIDKGLLNESDLENEVIDLDLREFIIHNGCIPDYENKELEDLSPAQYMAFYRQLQKIERKLGLGLELQEENGPAEI